MECHECDREAVGQCKSCGRAYCGGHGSDLCRACAVAIVAAEPHARPAPRMVYLQCENRPRMPTVYLDDDPGPPSCHTCGGLARHVCENCQQLYCPEHAGRRRGWCQHCTSSAHVGLLISLGVFGGIAALLTLMYVLHTLRP